MRYILVEENSPDRLTERVTEYLKRGFKPLGGVAVAVVQYENERKGYNETAWTYAQAMTSTK